MPLRPSSSSPTLFGARAGALLGADAGRAAYLEVLDTVLGSTARVLDAARQAVGAGVTVEVKARMTEETFASHLAIGSVTTKTTGHIPAPVVADSLPGDS